MKKTIIIFLSVLMLSGCVSRPRETTTQITEKPPTTETTSQVETTEATTAVHAKYNLKSGEYYNSPEGGVPYMCVAVIKQLNSFSFQFTIYQVTDSHGENFSKQKLIFRTHIAEFPSDDATTAVFYGQKYTLKFKCDYQYSFVLSGFKEGTRCGDIYSLSEAGSEYFGM